MLESAEHNIAIAGDPSVSKPQTYRMTQQRRVILEELRRTKSHSSADEVYEMVRKRLPRISLGTVEPRSILPKFMFS